MTLAESASLPGLVLAASPYLAGFDADFSLTKATALAYFNQGYRFCLRYLSLTTPEAPTDLTNGEASQILQAGLALMAVQHCLSAGWMPTEALGQQYGEAAATNAQAVGLPGGTSVWVDLEGVSPDAPASDVIAYCDAWCKAVAAARYSPGIYVGASPGLSASELSALPCRHFWKSASNVPEPSRGFQLAQDLTVDNVDPDLSSNDGEGGQAYWVAPGTPIYPTLSQSSSGGSWSAAVEGLQEALNAAGASPALTVNGYFGSGTDTAVKQFQRSAGLTPDGVAGGQTWSALVTAAAAPPETTSQARLPYGPVLPVTSAVYEVFAKCLGGIPSSQDEDLARQLALVLRAEPDPDAGSITPGDLSSIYDVLAALLADAEPGTALANRLSALTQFYETQAAASVPATSPQIAAVSAGMSQIGVVVQDQADPKHPELRTGAEMLLEIFVTAFGDDTSFSVANVTRIDNPVPPNWCGLFAVWAIKAAGVWLGDWSTGLGISAVPGMLPVTSPVPGDVGYIQEPNQHMFVVASVDGSNVWSVNGNSGSTGIIQMETWSLGAITAFYRATGIVPVTGT